MDSDFNVCGAFSPRSATAFPDVARVVERICRWTCCEISATVMDQYLIC